MLTRGLHTGQLPTSHGLRAARPRPDRVSPCKSGPVRGSPFSGGTPDDSELFLNVLRKGLNELPKTLASFGDKSDGAVWREKISDWEKTLENMEVGRATDATLPRSKEEMYRRMWNRAEGPSPWSPSRVSPEYNRASRQSSEMVVPVDIEEYPESYALWLDVPGLQKSDVKIQVSPSSRTMTISGERKRIVSTEPTERVRHERRMGSFSRTVRLAKDLDASTIAAKVDRGVLHVTARKVPIVEPEDDSMEIPIQ